MNVFNKDIVLVIVVLIILAAVFQSFIAPYPQHAKEYVDFANVNKAPSAQFLLGTDSYGWDVLSRIVFLWAWYARLV